MMNQFLWCTAKNKITKRGNEACSKILGCNISQRFHVCTINRQIMTLEKMMSTESFLKNRYYGKSEKHGSTKPSKNVGPAKHFRKMWSVKPSRKTESTT